MNSLEYKHKRYKLNDTLIRLLYAYKYKCIYDKSILLMEYLYLILVILLARSIIHINLFWVGVIVITYLSIWWFIHHLYKRRLTDPDMNERIDIVYHMLQNKIHEKNKIIKLVENKIPTILIDLSEFPSNSLTRLIYLEEIREGVISKQSNTYPIDKWCKEILTDYNLYSALEEYEKPLLEFIKRL